MLEIVGCSFPIGSVRLSKVANLAVRFGYIFMPYGGGSGRLPDTVLPTVRRGFQEGNNPTVRCGTVKPHQTDRKTAP